MPPQKWRSVKTSAGVDVLPTPILPNKSLGASPTSKDKLFPPSTGDRNHLQTQYYVFPSLYHKYINYANYEHCILTKTRFPFAISLLEAKIRLEKRPFIIFNLPCRCSLFSVIPRFCKGPCHSLFQSHIIKNSSQLPDRRCDCTQKRYLHW